MKEIEKQMILDLAYAIRNLKESECQNSGLNWFDEFHAQYWDVLKSDVEERLGK